ncbi:MAG: transposase [Actinomycetota bacterium]
MPRAPRLDPLDGIHHVVNRGIDHGDVFVDESARLDFGRCIGVIADRFGVRILAYCLMTNHFHLVIRCPVAQLPDAMKYLSGVFTRHLNDRLGRDGPIFRGRYTSRLITTSRYVLNAVGYTLRNVLDLPGVRSVEQYRWSSHRAYLGLRPTPPWLDTDHVLQWFRDATAFHRHVSRPSGTATVGDVDAPTLLDAIGFLLAARNDDDGRVRPGDVRVVALHIADLVDSHSAGEIVRALGFPNDTARRNAESRARRRLDADPTLRALGADAIGLSSLGGLDDLGEAA